jgi:hypothetical protein
LLKASSTSDARYSRVKMTLTALRKRIANALAPTATNTRARPKRARFGGDGFGRDESAAVGDGADSVDVSDRSTGAHGTGLGSAVK